MGNLTGTTQTKGSEWERGSVHGDVGERTEPECGTEATGLSGPSNPSAEQHTGAGRGYSQCGSQVGQA